MATHVPSSLECPVCSNIFKNPKLLKCGHTFCLNCIENILAESQVRCPLCRRLTMVDEGDTSKLSTNLIASGVIDELKVGASCTAQRTVKHFNTAEYYCPNCKVFLCVQCEKIHHSWEPNRKHKVIAICESPQKYNTPQGDLIESGNVLEPTKSEIYICVHCNELLFGPSERDTHASKQHTIMSESSFASDTKKNAVNIQQTVTNTVKQIQTNRTFYGELELIMRTHSYDMIRKINEAYNEGLTKLDTWKLVQTKQCQILQEEVSRSYEYRDGIMTDCTHKLLDKSRLLSMSLANSDNITACATLCDDLCRTLKSSKGAIRDLKLEKEITSIVNSSVAGNSITTGTIKVNEWDTSQRDLVENKSMTSVAVSVNRQIAVSYMEGGVSIIDNSEICSPFALAGIKAMGVAFFSDGDVVIRDTQNQIKLFASKITPVSIKFNTLRYEDGVQGGLDVDHNDNIYVSYKEAKIIQMFNRWGGEAIREIDCGIYKPQQFAVISEQQLVVMDGEVISVVDVSGFRMHEIKYTGCHGYPAVSSDGSVLIAWVDRILGILRIDKYTSELKLIKCVYSSNMIQLSGRAWYYLRELPDGGLLFCTSTQLVILKPRMCDHIEEVTTPFEDKNSYV